MTKCDFCTQSDSDGKCPYTLRALRETYCKKAIALMVTTLKNNDSLKKNNREK